MIVDPSQDNSPPTPLRTDTKTAEEWKLEGNEHFKKGEYNAAVTCYSESLSIQPSAPVFANRSFCHLRLENFGTAISDATEAIKLDDTYIKGYYRRASANYALRKYPEAIKDFKEQVRLTPNNAEVRSKYDSIKKEWKSIQYLQAMERTEEVASEIFAKDIDSYVISSDYTGPRFTFPLTPENCPLSLISEETINYYRTGKQLPLRTAIDILLSVKQVLHKEPNVVTMQIPDTGVTVVGDTHGQFNDLLLIFEKKGFPGPSNKFVFNGDFVDRGSYSVEIVLLLFLLKLRFPSDLILLRGNHETHNMNSMFGFEGEVKAKYQEKLYQLFKEVFCDLPLCAVLTDERTPNELGATRVFVVHGGIPSKKNVTIEDIQQVHRYVQPPSEDCIFSELIWNDPQDMPGLTPSQRGVGHQFGPDVTASFLANNNLSYMIRSHQVQDEGFMSHHNHKLFTVFSAPNYCDSMTNKAAIATVWGREKRIDGEDRPEFYTYSASPLEHVKAMKYASSMFQRMM
ncbi:putative Serine/threonine-protein phosphatase [Blattamonas nauphoetae]|uniref:Serine/threonine-protein phosphatase n=1 Tax=Blattamonas nauphoetae TaxID=2049346 RepID=A0ABQ9WWZ2_9EUKA|nr:putative Serine/threonine-protein phosphatase [Blattamonas nauphoetae]